MFGEWWLNENKYASLRAIFKIKKSLIKMKNGSNFEYFMGLGIHKGNIYSFKIVLERIKNTFYWHLNRININKILQILIIY